MVKRIPRWREVVKHALKILEKLWNQTNCGAQKTFLGPFIYIYCVRVSKVRVEGSVAVSANRWTKCHFNQIILVLPVNSFFFHFTINSTMEKWSKWTIVNSQGRILQVHELFFFFISWMANNKKAPKMQAKTWDKMGRSLLRLLPWNAKFFESMSSYVFMWDSGLHVSRLF